MFTSKEVRVLIMLSNAPKQTIVMSNLSRRLNVNAGIKAEEKNKILEKLQRDKLIELVCNKIPALKRVPTYILLTSKGKKIAKSIKKGDVYFSDT